MRPGQIGNGHDLHLGQHPRLVLLFGDQGQEWMALAPEVDRSTFGRSRDRDSDEALDLGLGDAGPEGHMTVIAGRHHLGPVVPVLGKVEKSR